MKNKFIASDFDSKVRDLMVLIFNGFWILMIVLGVSDVTWSRVRTVKYFMWRMLNFKKVLTPYLKVIN